MISSTIWGTPRARALPPSSVMVTCFFSAATASWSRMLRLSRYRSTASHWAAGLPSSRRESLMMSFTRPIRRWASRWMLPAKWGMSSGFTRPFSRISAVPRMEVRGVFSSWDTLAVNSRRSASRCSFSVTSSTISTAPFWTPSCSTGLAKTRRHSPSRSSSSSRRRPARASSTQRRKPASRSRARTLSPSSTGRSQPSSFKAAELWESTRVSWSMTSNPSLMFSVMASNSSRRCRNVSTCRWIWRFWLRIFPMRGDSSS